MDVITIGKFLYSLIALLLFYDGFTDSLDEGQLIVLHEVLFTSLFGSAIALI